jgi:hypothetical protein
MPINFALATTSTMEETDAKSQIHNLELLFSIHCGCGTALVLCDYLSLPRRHPHSIESCITFSLSCWVCLCCYFVCGHGCSIYETGRSGINFMIAHKIPFMCHLISTATMVLKVSYITPSTSMFFGIVIMHLFIKNSFVHSFFRKKCKLYGPLGCLRFLKSNNLYLSKFLVKF